MFRRKPQPTLSILGPYHPVERNRAGRGGQPTDPYARIDHVVSPVAVRGAAGVRVHRPIDADYGTAVGTDTRDRAFWPASGELLVAADAGVQVHVVPAVGVDGVAALGALQEETGFDGDPAGSIIAGRVI